MNDTMCPVYQWIENRVFDEIAVGDRASGTRTLTWRDAELIAAVCGDVTPAQVDPDHARHDRLHRPIVVHGAWTGALVSSVLDTQLPGPGTIHVSQELHFLAPILLGDTITTTVTVTGKDPTQASLMLDCRSVNQHNTVVIVGKAEVLAPEQKLRLDRIEEPDVRIADHRGFRSLMRRVAGGPAVPMALVHPCDEVSLGAAVEAARQGLIVPTLVGPAARIRAIAANHDLDITPFSLVDAPHSHAAATLAVSMVREGKVSLLMKGSLHTDELMHAALGEDGLRTDRRASHVYLMDIPGHDTPLLISDAALNIAPKLEHKRDIVQNAIDLARAIGIDRPRIALLSAIETINPAIASTLDAAALCKMAERGQIHGGIVDGPLALDNAVNLEAAREKDIRSPVAGMADVLIAPDLESANMLAKQLTFLSDADAAGIVMGAQVPIILTSRADSPRARLASCAIGVLLARKKLLKTTTGASA